MISETVSGHLTREVVAAALAYGVPAAELARLPGLAPRELAGDLVRVPTDSLTRTWQLAQHAADRDSAGIRVGAGTAIGRLDAWDYLFTSNATLADACRDAAGYLNLIGDPTDGLSVTEGDDRFVFRYLPAIPVLDGVEMIHEFALSLLLSRAQAAVGRPLVPLQVRLPHRPPRHHRLLVEGYGTTRIEYGAEESSLVFAAADGRAPLPGADPHLAGVLRRYADLAGLSARPAPTWQDRFRSALSRSLAEDDCSLTGVARRLTMSARSLQRQLQRDGTSWREEVETTRYEQATRLLTGTSLSVTSIAARVGYSDARALRRAFRRWDDQSPDAYRRARAPA